MPPVPAQTQEIDQTALIVEAIDFLNQCFVIYGPDYEVLYANPTAQSEWGTSFKAIEDGCSFHESIFQMIKLRHPEADEATLKIVAENSSRFLEAGLPTYMRMATGRVSLSMLQKLPNGHKIALSMDVNQLQERQKGFKKAWQKAEASNKAKSAFLANISHEIRTPLNGILGMAHALSSGPLTSEQREQVDALVESGQLLMALLNDVLDFSKVGAGRFELAPAETNLRRALQYCQKLWLPRAQEKSIGLNLVFETDLEDYYIFDNMRVVQCVTNLISNAIKFTHDGLVEVRVRVDACDSSDRLVTIAVSDTGIGLTADIQTQIFEPFAQADASTSRRFGGTGLGLSIAREFARLMGGDIAVESNPGEGATFTFTFKVQASNQKPKEQTAGEAGETTQEIEYDSLKLLLVDDNPLNRQVIKLFLKPFQGTNIVEAANGREALDILARDGFDLVLLDMHMPVMSGLEVIETVRNGTQTWKDIPVIALTADASSDDRERYLAAGLSGYVAKPVEVSHLLNEINRVLTSGNA